MDLVKFFFTVQTSLKFYHWRTSSYARHIASDSLVNTIITLSDKFMEIYQGKYGKLNKNGDMEIICKCLNDSDITELLKEAIEFLNNIEETIVDKGDTDLLNIRDEIVGAINQTLYLFTFK